MKSFVNSFDLHNLNAGGIYLKLGLADVAFIQSQHLFGSQRLPINNGIFLSFSSTISFCHKYLNFTLP